MVTTEFADIIGDRIAAEHGTLAARWFERLRELVPVRPNEVFPSDRLLDHIPSLIVDLSRFVKSPEEEAIAANTHVVGKARELGTLRHEQRASLHQVLREYQLLGHILMRFVEEECVRLKLTPAPGECMVVAARVHGAVNALLQETVETFVRLYTDTISEQSERLRQFTRMATHEWRQPLAPISAAVSLLRLPGLTTSQRAQTVDMIARNVTHLVELTYKLERVARLDSGADDPSMQDVSLTAVATEAARQLRDMANARNVALLVDADMPSLIVDVGRLELALVNLMSNAIKYSDPTKEQRFVKVSATAAAGGGCEIHIADNGIGIPADRIDGVFRRFTRAHADQEQFEAVSGVGLGLAIVDDCVRAMNGTTTLESTPGQGTRFRITLPAPGGEN